jgi:hypothetical protein
MWYKARPIMMMCMRMIVMVAARNSCGLSSLAVGG